MMDSRIYQACPVDKIYANTNNGAQVYSQITPEHYPYSNFNQMHGLCDPSPTNISVTRPNIPMYVNKPYKWINTLPNSNHIYTTCNKGRENYMHFFLNSQDSFEKNMLPHSRFHCGICYSVFITHFELDEHIAIHHRKIITNGNVSKSYTPIGRLNPENSRPTNKHSFSLGDKWLLPSSSKILENTRQYVDHSIPSLTSKVEDLATKFRCKICYILYDNQPDLDAHQKIHIKICKVCKEVFPSLDELDSHHIRLHELPCELCDGVFQTLDGLDQHKVECKGEYDEDYEEKIACEICCQTFSSESDLDEHFPAHGVERKYTCKVCKLTFRNKSLYDIHYNHHIKCPLCPRRFQKREEVHVHRLRKHMKWRKDIHFKCIVCEQKFIFRRQYVFHLKIHTGEDALLFKKKEVNVQDKEPEFYSCNHCKMKFNSRQLLKEHRISHFEKHKCVYPSCEKTFMKKTDLVRHIGIHEGHEFKCDQCDKVYSSDFRMQIHKNLVHNKLYVMICEVCGKKCTNRRTFKAHKLTHDGTKDIICEKCGKMFISSKMLRLHLKSHTKPHKCDVCGEHFSRADNMKLHKRKHTKEKPYKCYYCDRTFSRKDNMNTHIKCHTNDRK